MDVAEPLQKAIKKELARTDGHPFAVFDFDNTCIVNDVGEATLTYLCQNRLLKDFSLLPDVGDETEYHERAFDAYHDLCDEGKIREAYIFYAKIFSGFNPEEAHRATCSAIGAEGNELGTREVFGRTLAHGLKLNPHTMALFDFVRSLGIAVWVVSASNEISVRAAMEHFGLEAEVIGVRQIEKNGVFTQEIEKPTSILEGKVECVRTYISNDTSPLMVVDDSMTGIALLETAAIKVVVDRGNELTKVARERGWFIVPRE